MTQTRELATYLVHHYLRLGHTIVRAYTHREVDDG